MTRRPRLRRRSRSIGTSHARPIRRSFEALAEAAFLTERISATLGITAESRGVAMAARKPKLYSRIRKRYPKYVGAVESLGEIARGVGPLDREDLAAHPARRSGCYSLGGCSSQPCAACQEGWRQRG